MNDRDAEALFRPRASLFLRLHSGRRCGLRRSESAGDHRGVTMRVDPKPYPLLPNARLFTPAAVQALRTSTTRCSRVLGEGVTMTG